MSYDIGLPRPLWWYRQDEHSAPEPVPEGRRVTALNDQYAYLDSDRETSLRVGDMVGLRHLAPVHNVRQMAAAVRRR